MTIREIVGMILIASPFVVLFIAVMVAHGIEGIVLTFSPILAFAVIAFGAYLVLAP